MLALLVALLAVVKPPTAYIATPTGHVPLVISSWCWDRRCGAPIAAATKTALVSRNSTAVVELRFVPTRVRLAVDGGPVTPHLAGRELTWQAGHGGGITLTAFGTRGWVTYVGRLRMRG